MENLPVEKKPRRPLKKITDNDRTTFLDLVSQGMTIKEAAEAACHPANSFNKLGQYDPEFRELMEEAKQIGTDVIEAEARRRGVEGFKKPVIGKVAPGIDGQLKDEEGNLLWEIIYSDKLLEVLLKGRRPEYRDNQRVDITNQTLNVAIDDRSAALSAVAKVLADAGVTLEATEGLNDGRGSSYQELPES